MEDLLQDENLFVYLYNVCKYDCYIDDHSKVRTYKKKI